MIDASPWPGLTLGEPLTGGHRNEVMAGTIGTERVAVRRSRRSPSSLDWELGLIARLSEHGFHVPTVVPAEGGHQSVDGVVVQRWVDGREPSSVADWSAVAHELGRLHQAVPSYGQRPGCVVVTELRDALRSVDADLDRIPTGVAEQILAVFDEFAPPLWSQGDEQRTPPAVALIHGDPAPSNIRMQDDGTVAFLDWDESRVDLTWHDLSNLGVQVLGDDEHRRALRLSNAWEAANAWTVEPDYARHRLRLLAEDS